MMTATATPKTIRVLKNQLPEITKWRNLISPPLRRNVVTIVPPPEVLSSKVEVLLAPFIHDMRINQTPYLILVRGTNFQLFPLCILNFFPLLISRHKQRNPHLSPPFENCEWLKEGAAANCFLPPKYKSRKKGTNSFWFEVATDQWGQEDPVCGCHSFLGYEYISQFDIK